MWGWWVRFRNAHIPDVVITINHQEHGMSLGIERSIILRSFRWSLSPPIRSADLLPYEVILYWVGRGQHLRV